MPRITAAATALPSHKFHQEEVKDWASGHFRFLPRVERLIRVFDNMDIDHRYLSRPLAWHDRSRSWSEKTQAYIETATALGAQLITRISDESHFSPEDFDSIIFVNSTGLATPSIDARLMAELPLDRNIRRTPLWGLGCAGGVSGLAHAWTHTLAHPKHRVLVIAIELCSLTFLSDDYSTSNLVASALFSDGAAAIVVEGDECDSEGPAIQSARSTIFPDSLDLMAWNVLDEGLQVVFARRIPAVIRSKLANEVTEFLSAQRLTVSDIGSWILHPGGPKVLSAIESAIGVDTRAARSVLKDFGNMSSATVLFVLGRFLEHGIDRYGVVSAFGPGFSSELILLKS